MIARGTFDVKLSGQPPEASGGGPFGRQLIDKHYHGDLEATSQGQMLGFLSADHKSGGYVALEQVAGTLHGKRGSFMLQHTGTMDNGKPTLHVTVVPQSGTDELQGISGQLTIIIKGSKHSYELEYELLERSSRSSRSPR